MRASDNAPIAPAEWGNYQAGKHSPDHSLPNGYQLIGFLLENPKVGRQLKVLRVSRNGVKAPGIYMSSAVTGITGDQLHTHNSVYRLRYIDASPEKLQAMLASVAGLALRGSITPLGRN